GGCDSSANAPAGLAPAEASNGPGGRGGPPQISKGGEIPMKKFLSLVLALVMTMSLVTVSAGAKDFTDSEDLSGEAYAEAVNVMSEMG
ncbi:hypothetical protein HEAFMP_HEAFMP_15105, partial [Dysosmobacter welbionis]